MSQDRVLSRTTPLFPGLRLCGCLLLIAGTWLVQPGCSGCRQDPPATKSPEEDAQKKAKKKPDYEMGRLEVVPSDDARLRNFVKPGHAVTATMSAVANVADLRAEVVSEVTNLDGAPLPMANTNYHLVMSRPAVLPKGQRKSLEFTYFVPYEVSENSALFLRHTLRAVRGGGIVHTDSEATRAMPAYQYLFVVLSANPNAYGYWKQLDTVRPVFDELVDEGSELVYYRVVLPAVKEQVPLPSHPFAWSPIAYVLWDGSFAERMTADQQQAMLSWLHWGGQLIISGPGSLDRLAGSFLAPYLPAADDGALELAAEAVQPLNEYWSLTQAKSNTRLTLNVAATSPLVGIRLRPQPAAEVVAGTGELVIERRVGRGRVVVTAFSLSAPDVVNWGSFDSFVNNALLRRPRRVFSATQLGSARTRWAEFSSRELDPLLVTATRYFARDAAHLSGGSSRDSLDAEVDWHLDGCEARRLGGVGSWNDASGAAEEAHRVLQDAAGVSIPQASFVLSVLVIYLVILVPVNWAVFRLVRRVEWAWAAAPVIAIVGAAAVIRLAQLDIGFVRSRTEIAVVEMHAGHPDAHVTRYTALYSSLSTSYELQFEDPSGVARPFPPTPSPDRLWPVMLRRDEGVELSGFQVDSSTTGFVHSEQMCRLGGAIQLVGDTAPHWSVENGTALNLHHVQLLYGAPSGILTCQWNELPAGAIQRIAWTALAPDSGLPAGAAAGVSTRAAGAGEINLQGLAELAARGLVLRPGDVRLVAWSDDTLPGLVIKPTASQARMRALVLVHLRFGPLPPPHPDVNLRVDVQSTRPETDAWDELPAEDPEASQE